MNDDTDRLRRRLSHDTSAPWTVRPGYVVDPEAAQRDWPWALGGLLALAAVVGLTLWLVPGIMR